MASSVVSLILQGKDEASEIFDRVGGKLGGLKGAALGLAAGGVVALAGVSAAALAMSGDVDTAADTIQTQLGLARDEAENLADVATNVFANNFGDSMEDAAAGVVTVRQQMDRLGEMSESELGAATEAAFALRDAFDVDLQESTNAAGALMQQFGMSGQEAMDFITAGMQNGLNSSGDFLDSIGEYSNLFADAGFDAGQMFSIMDTGLQSGVLGTDKIADAIKEMGIKLSEGGDDVSAAFDAIGMDFEQIQGFVASGDEAWADYFDSIVGGLAGIEDPTQRAIAQTAIFGTMAEDLGVSFTDGLSSAGTAVSDLAGSTESLNAQYSNWPSMWEGIKRQTSVALLPLGDKLVEIVNDHMPQIEAAFAWFAETAPIWIDQTVAGIEWLIPIIQNAWETGEQLGVIIVYALSTASTAVTQLGTIIRVSFQNAWDAARGAVESAWGKISPIIDAIKNFGNWLKEHVFNFKFELPSLPDWALPGSPLPLHTAWQDFGDYLNRNEFEPRVNVGGAAGLLPSAGSGNDAAAAGSANGGGAVYQFAAGSIVVKDETTGRALLAWLQGVQDRDGLGAFA